MKRVLRVENSPSLENEQVARSLACLPGSEKDNKDPKGRTVSPLKIEKGPQRTGKSARDAASRPRTAFDTGMLEEERKMACLVVRYDVVY
ncbi:hypothetical protein SNOG_00407 [Parastagonospora nodorum SN15]|uniref:Uncharacterized protein n=1 Tax=Phaeosphaeria nodorum (strain SN15 / ATCC MYA-4574 / FGSC 10173) TaxID=321614 RepID=Q0V6F7_PHANO|nr:hypothetical protein SNOG_00407 [Parastagonospora nodorum SN15]EAT91902.1 hypothetical protein SNOG_00407 [Parastagonospora nodorum SN15]